VECFLVHPPHQGLRGTRAPSASGQGRALSFPECLKSFYNGWSCVLLFCRGRGVQGTLETEPQTSLMLNTCPGFLMQ
jgi:hypothetical protein